MAIKRNSYHNGKVQSLGFTDSHGTDWTVGVLEPGEYRFQAERHESIHVLHGSITDCKTGKTFYSDKGIMMLPHFRPGDTVHISCEDVAVYLCRYDDDWDD